MLAACKTSTSAPTINGALDSFKIITMSKRDTCETQKQIAEHNSRFDTLKTGKDTVYKPPCETEQKVAAK